MRRKKHFLYLFIAYSYTHPLLPSHSTKSFITMASEKVETIIAGSYLEMEREEGSDKATAKSKISTFLWHGGSAYDAWFSCASNQVNILPEFITLFLFLIHDV